MTVEKVKVDFQANFGGFQTRETLNQQEPSLFSYVL